MSKLYSYTLLVLMLLPLVIIPIPGVAQVGGGVSVKADTNNYANLEPTSATITVSNNAALWIIINNTQLTWLGDQIRISLILSANRSNPNVGGYFFRVSNIGDYGPSNPAQSPYGGVIYLYTNSTLKDEYDNTVGNVTNLEYDSSNITVIYINLAKINLSSVYYINNVYLETSEIRNLYTTDPASPTLLAVKVFKASSWDAVVSDNDLKIVYIPISCNDIEINVFNTPVIHYQNTTIQVSFKKFFDKIYAYTDIRLNISEDNLTLVRMYNVFEPDGNDNVTLVNFTNGVLTTDGGIVFSVWNVEYNESAVNFTGNVTDYPPSEVDPSEPYVSALYGFVATFKHEVVNETYNFTFFINCTSFEVSSSTTPFLRVNASMVISTIDDVFGDPYDTNPHDIVEFAAFNVPEDYFVPSLHVSSFNLTHGSTIFSISAIAFTPAAPLGIIYGSFELPDKPYGGSSFWTYLVFDDGKWIRDGLLTIHPYFETYIVTNDTLWAVDHGAEYEGHFVEEDFAAPGDYLYIKGWGYNITNTTNFVALLDSVELYQWALAVSSDTGKLSAVVRVSNLSFYPVAPGSYILSVGFLGTPSNFYAKPFEVVINETVQKYLFFNDLRQIIRWNGTDYSLFHVKLGEPYSFFEVRYPLVNDTFQTITWPDHNYIELIGFPGSYVNLTFHSLTWGLTFQFLNLTLIHGYNRTLLQGLTIPFLPYGNYTLRFDDRRINNSIHDRRMFKVYMGIDVDADPCRNGTLTVNIVGGAPNTEMTLNFSYRVNETIHNYSPTGTPWWNGILSVNVTTNIFGVGSESLPLTVVYPDGYVENATLDTLIFIGISLEEIENIGNASLLFTYNASLVSIDDNLGTGIDYELGPSDTNFSFIFYVFATYNFTLTINVTTILPRAFFVISVPEAVLPRDSIVVQIFPHTVDVWDLLIEPEWMFDVEPDLVTRIIWHLDVRLVDPLTNEIVNRVYGYYAGDLMFADLDDDGYYEFWFVAELMAPFVLGVDKTYRVDTKLMFALTVSNTTEINISLVSPDDGCHNNVTVNGTIYFEGIGTYLFLGDDDQIVTVLGVLEAKLDRIYNGIVELNATVNDMFTYIKVNVTEFLNAINNTVVEIKNDTATLIAGQAVIEMKLDALFNLTMEVNETVTMIFACCGDISSRLERMEGTLNDTHDYVLAIHGDLLSLIDTINYVVIPKFAELYNNITVQINASRDTILYQISEVNNTLVNYLLLVDSHVQDVRDIIVSQVIPLMNWYYGNLSIEISDVNATILAELYDVNSSIQFKIDMVYMDLNNTLTVILDELEEYYMDLENKIDNVYSNLTAKIDNSTATILAELSDVNRSIIVAINTSTNRLCNRLMDIRNLIVTEFNTTMNLIESANASLSAFINDTKLELLTKLDEVNSSLSMLVIDEANMLHDLIVDVAINLTAKLDMYYMELENKIEDVYANLTMKIDNSTMTILHEIYEANESIITFVNFSTNRLCNRLSMIQNLIETRFNETFNLISSVNASLTASINDAKVELLTKLNDVNASLSMLIVDEANMLHDLIVEATLNLTAKLTEYYMDLETKIDNVYSNLTMQIDDSTTTILQKIDAVNNSIILFVNFSTNRLCNRLMMLQDLVEMKFNETFNLIRSANASLTAFINDTKVELLTKLSDVNSTVTTLIMDKAEMLHDLIVDATLNLTMKLTEYYMELENKIENAYNNLTMQIDNSTTRIINEIYEANESIIMFINMSTNRLCNKLMMLQDLVEMRFNETFNLIRNVNATIMAKIDETKMQLETLLNNINASLTTKIESEANMTRELLTALISNLNTTIMNRLDEMEGTILVYMTAYEQRLEGLIEETADDIIYNITLALDNDFNALKNLINVRADEIVFKLNESTTTILARLDNLEVTLMGKLDDIETLINNAKADIMTELGKIETTLDNYYNALSNLISTSTVDIKVNVTKNVENAVDKLSTLTLKVNNTLTLLIKGKASELTGLINKLNTDLSTALNDAKSTILDKLSGVNKTLSGKLDNVKSALSTEIKSNINSQTTTLKNELSSVAKQLSDKLDTVAKTQKDSTDKINGNISVFGSATLLLLVIVIGLVGYSIISGRRAPG